MAKYEALCRRIVKLVGGRGNIRCISHCITRLRFYLKDEKKADIPALRSTEGIITTLQATGQIQVVIGNHVLDVYEELCELTGFVPGEDGTAEFSGSIFDRLITLVAGCFQPFVGVLCATGMLKGFNALFLFLGFYSATDGTYLVLNAIGESIFHFMPMILAITSSAKFGLNRYTGFVIGAALCYGIPAGAEIETIFGLEFSQRFLGLPLIAQDYTSSVVPVIMIIWFASHIERKAKKIIPDVVATFFVPFFTLLISLVAGFLIIGPLVTAASSLISDFFIWLCDVSPLLFGLVLGALWQCLVIFGLHWSLIPIALLNTLLTSGDPIMSAVFCATFAQTACVFAMYLKSKDANLRALCVPAMISGICGVTEPAIYGITLPEKKPFYFSLVGAAIGGACMMLSGTRNHMMGGLGIFGVVNFLPSDTHAASLAPVFLSLSIASLISFFLTFFFWSAPQKAPPSIAAQFQPLTAMAHVAAPLEGAIIPLEDLDDEVFRSGTLGKGIAILPESATVLAPFSGIVETLSEQQHALYLRSTDGVELLIHIGLDTLGCHECFQAHVKTGDSITLGQALITIDFDALRSKGCNLQTPVIVTNSDAYAEVLETVKEHITYGDRLLTAIQ